ncbi:MAG: hypothetical protein QOE14_2268 [Humisphaera sp.]|nr:hypothetical protein [Humisphaera sp.]
MATPLLVQAQAVASSNEKLILSVPLTHSDWMLHPNTPWGMPGVKQMLDACKACGWSRVLWRVFDAGRATYASKLLARGLHHDPNSIFSPLTDADKAAVKRLLPGLTAEQSAKYLKQMAAMDYAGFDTLAAACEYGHSIGLQIHAWATINEDDHGWGWASEFSKAHPQFRWKRRDGSSYQSQLSFAFPEVREYKLALIKELIAYPIDGLFLDWIRTGDIRDNPQTDANGVADNGYEQPNVEAFKSKFNASATDVPNDDDRWVRVRAEPQTVFMRAARKLTGKLPVSVMVGHPWHYRGTGDKIAGNLKGLLLDVKTWADEGLMDAAVPAGYYRDGGNAEMAYKALRDETSGAGGKVDVWTYGWVPNNVGEFDRDYQLARNLGAKQILFWEADYIDVRPNAAELKAAMSAKAKW